MNILKSDTYCIDFLFILTIWPYRFKEQQSQRGYFGLDWLQSTEYRSLTQQLLSKNCVLAVLLPSPRIWKLLRPSHPRFFLPFELFLSTNCKDMQLLLHLIPGEFFYWTSRMTACSRTVTTHTMTRQNIVPFKLPYKHLIDILTSVTT